MMSEKEQIRLSKFLSLVLRHKPEAIGLELDEGGWADVEELIDKMNRQGCAIDRDTLEYVVENNSKKRFAFSEDRRRIRASQGHSIEVELGYTPQAPPPVLYHGTGRKNVGSILKGGLKKQKRHHVHLSPDRETALQVGRRHGKPVIFEVAAGRMQEAGYQFHRSENGVWLVEEVPVEYLREV